MTALTDIHLFPDADGLARGAAAFVAAAAEQSIRRRGRFTIALSGGSTPRRLYETLAEDEEPDWANWHVFWSDERCVRREHADSNYGMAKLALLDHVEIPREHVHRVETEHLALVAARRYEETIRAELGGPAPAFDLVLLGIGEDGHTASLFPGDPAARERVKLVTTSRLGGPGPARVTFTLPLINAARRAVFLAAGESKAAMVRQAIEPGLREPGVPAGLVAPTKGSLHWFLSQDAAAELRSIPA